MKTIKLYLLLFFSLCSGLGAYSQSISNTDHVITITNTCLHATSGSYTLAIYYSDDGGTETPITNVPVTVSDNGTTFTITGPANSFPVVGGNTFYSLADAVTGTIVLSNGPGGASVYMGWQKDFNNTMYPDCGVFPIYFSSFIASLSAPVMHLGWNTYLEQNTTVIEIYRNTPGTNGYYKIGQVAAAGNNNGPVAYTFTDNNPGFVNKYYLKMLNSQGSLPKISDTITASCAVCSYTQTPVNCTQYSITGPDYVCNMGGSTLYSLNTSLPNYNTITWSIDQPSVAVLRTYPTIDPTKVTLLKKNAAAELNITANISGCSNPITKHIIVGTPTPDIYADQECPMVVCQPAYAPGATSYTWNLTNASQATNSYSSGFLFQGYIGDGNLYDVGLQYTNACGTSGWYTVGNFYCEPGQSESARRGSSSADPNSLSMTTGVVTWPNPTRGVLNVMLPPPAATGGITAPSKIYQVRIVDAQGVAHKTVEYPGGIDKAVVDISNLASGVYIVRIYDKHRWIAKQVVLAK